MIKMLVSSGLTAAATVAGVVGGKLLAPPPPVQVIVAESAEGTAEGAEADAAKDEEGEVEVKSVVNPDYFPIRFSRPFVVPVTNGVETRSLVVLQLSVDLHNDVSNDGLGMEQRLRDRIMSALIRLSHEGHLSGSVTNSEMSDKIRTATKDMLETIFPEKVGDVYILEILQRRI